MPFATTDDIAARLGRDALTETEETQAAALIAAATSTIADAVDQDDDWAADLDPVPTVITTVTVELVVRTMRNPSSLRNFTERLGAYSTTEGYRDSGGGLVLTRAERKMVRKAVGLSTFQAVTYESPYSGTSLDDWPELPLDGS